MLSVHKLSKRFDGVYAPVLDEVSFSLQRGDFCTVIGANGSGKSTLFKIISGEYLADSGKVQRGDAGSGLPAAVVAQVTQDINKGTVPELSILENLALSMVQRPGLLFYRRLQASIKQAVQTLDLKLEDALDRPLGLLSGGQKQMLATLMAFESAPEIVLLDEHTSVD
jgi:putative ABC transport system ATP-binding protein